MPSSPANVLVVSNPSDRREIVDILVAAGYDNLTVGDGNDETLVSFQRDQPGLVIVCANLDQGDARSLIATMRDSVGGDASKIVLIGEIHGPIRNALDASDFAVDRFLARPLAGKALLFAVRTCLGASRPHAVAAQAKPPAPPAPPRQRTVDPVSEAEHAAAVAHAAQRAAPSPELARKMETAMNRAIDDFVRDAIQALPAQTRRARPTIVAPPPPPPSTRGPDAPTPASEATHADTAADEPSRADVSAARDTDAAAAPSIATSEAATDAPAWRQPTVILPEPEPPSSRPADSLPASGAELGRVALTRVSVAREEAGEPKGAEFARKLRRKMSDMAERLFPGQQARNLVSSGLGPNPSPDIDLGELDDSETVVEDPPGEDEVLLAGLPSEPDDTSQVTGLEGAPPVDARDDAPASAPLDAAIGPPGGEPQSGASTPPPAARSGPAAGSKPAARTTPAARRSPGPPRSGSASGAATTTRTAASERGPVMAAGTRPGLAVVLSAPPGGADAGEICRGQADAPLLIERMFRRQLTGKIEFRQGQVEKDLLLENGRLVFAISNLPEDRMGEQLYREGKITGAQLGQVRDLVASSGRRVGEVLIEMGWLKRRELLPVVRRHIEDVVYSLFAWESGRYRVVEGDFAAGERIRISRHPAAMILEGVRRKYDRESLAALCGGPESILEIVDDRQLKTVMSVADLSPAERKVIASFDGERSLASILATGELGLAEIYQLAYGLLVWGAAQILRRSERGALVAPEQPASSGATDLAIDRQRVLARHALVSEADYFTLLGVRRDATSFEIKRAYETACRDYAGDGFPLELRRELGPEISEINELIDEAYQVLLDDGLRSAYLGHLRD